MIARSLLSASDFTMVRAALVRELGSTDLAVILTRIAWRCEAQSDGWWKANIHQIAVETGLSENVVQKGLSRLRAEGHLLGEQRSGGYDRTMSYCLNMEEVSDLSKLPNGVMDDVDSHDVPTSKTTKTVVDEVVPTDKGQQHQVEQLSTPRGKVWVPSAAAAAEVVEIVRELDPAEHLVHYRVRCYELDKRPTDREWVRWFIRDQQKLRAEIEQASNTGLPEQDDTGTPLSWGRRN